MKLKIPNGVLIVDILSVLLVLSILIIPSTPVRVILGLPFLLFFPGYTLVTALFAKKKEVDGIELVALSGGMSIAVVGLIGFGLDYTPWGVRLEPALLAITAFILVTSAVALIRKRLVWGSYGFINEFSLGLPRWEGTTVNKTLTVVLVIGIFAALGVLGYTIAMPKVGETFTEFYILGINGRVEAYPTQFTMDNGMVTEVVYGDGTADSTSGMGKVTLGIVNHEQQTVTYTVRVNVDGEAADINLGGTIYPSGFPVVLNQGEKWEDAIGFAPRHVGDNQKVELLIFKGAETTPADSLHLWINVRAAE